MHIVLDKEMILALWIQLLMTADGYFSGHSLSYFRKQELELVDVLYREVVFGLVPHQSYKIS